MKSALDFLVTARQCEIAELEQLAHTCALVELLGRLTHALQRERGLSNVLLGSRGAQFADARAAQMQECDALAQQARAAFNALDPQVRNGARLFSRVAFVLHGLDALPALRSRIDAQAISAQEATAALVRLIGGLLAVVFEAADSATDPQISRALVAMFNFMQGKELAGQERAHGSASFAAGHSDATHQQQWLHLIESQERCFQMAANFWDAAVQSAWQAVDKDSPMAELERLRRIGCALRTDGSLAPELATRWYDCCTRRIDGMKSVEELQAARLRELCESRIAQARTELSDQRALLERLAAAHQAPALPEPALYAGTAPAEPAAHAPYGPQLERSILTMLQEQAQRLQRMGDELESVRATLTERKDVERAKGLLMAHRRLSEEEAYRMLRQTAMQQNRRVAEVARAVLAMADYLSAPAA